MLNKKFATWLSRSVAARSSANAMGLPLTLLTDIGLRRHDNQDRVVAMRVSGCLGAEPFIVVALADGMGGMANGEECAVEGIASFFVSLIQYRHLELAKRVGAAAHFANVHVGKLYGGRGGATLSAIAVAMNSEAVIVNVGDSRIYARVPFAKGADISRLTVDDSLQEAVGGTGTELLQFLGMGEGISPHVYYVNPDVDRILLTSDGIHFINQDVISDILISAKETSEVALQLSTYARWRGAPDNASLAVGEMYPLYACLQESSDADVELWDPSGALHIMWPNAKEFQGAFSDLEPSSGKDNTSKGEVKSATRKRKPREGKLTNRKNIGKSGHQLTIDINPKPYVKTGDEKNGDDIS